MDGWIDGHMADGWWMEDGWISGWMGGWMSEWGVDAWVDG